jgi:hypothetical protein
MHEVYLHSVSDTFLVAIPFIAIVAFAVFRLDALFATSKGSAGTAIRRRAGCGMDENGEPILVDPDGQTSVVRSGKRAN